uniref:GH16 domain-containing protein n=2 Tax=Physcomitrium patens TaxID=3218 RepID=A0A2K1K3M9_PHYPA|nr:hypothetical protein PHYPA_012856 [Physcomitrium patens]
MIIHQEYRCNLDPSGRGILWANRSTTMIGDLSVMLDFFLVIGVSADVCNYCHGVANFTTGTAGTCSSWGTYLFGTFSIGVRAVPGNSACTVTAFYLQSPTASDIDQLDEIDFELLGRISPRNPYILQTNINVKDSGRREQRMALWFDPNTDYHYYSLQWSGDLIVFYVDYVPIRVFQNNEALSIPYPDSNPMRAYATLWDSSIWATVDGNMRVHPIKWVDAPSQVLDGAAYDQMPHVSEFSPCPSSPHD